MRAALVIVVLILCHGCGCRGYTPHYILTDSPETKEAMQKCQKEPEQSDSLLPDTSGAESPK